ncbi:MAG: hypothetical protein MZV64_25050 [Ignavibacteriales bacterium]|nr:hypothetical protein [Ignavibacteriales bacterium]
MKPFLCHVRMTLNNMVAVFWDDFFSNGPQGAWKTVIITMIAVNHRFIVEWDNVHIMLMLR